jgi:hypothetical protein
MSQGSYSLEFAGFAGFPAQILDLDHARAGTGNGDGT